jgi:hypothetical protein
METIFKNQARLELNYSILASELTDLQAKYADSQMLLEQTTYMLKLEQLKVQQKHTFPANDEENVSRDWIMPRPTTHTPHNPGFLCDLVYLDITMNMKPSVVAKFEA